MTSKVYLFAITLAFVALAFNIVLPTSLAAILFLVAIVIIGIPHGALDFYIAKSLQNKPSLIWQLAFLSSYSLITVFSITVWLTLPTMGLVAFLLISVYHFSSDWTSLLPIKIALALATTVLCAPALIYQTIIIDTFTILLLPQEHALILSRIMQSLAMVCFVFLLLKVTTIQNAIGSKRWQIIELVGLLCSAVLLPPLLHFVLYFCLLHSVKHWSVVSRKLKLNFKQMVLVSAPIVAATVFGGASIWAISPSNGHFIDIIRLVFIGLFGLTVAHMLLIDKWHRQFNITSTP